MGKFLDLTGLGQFKTKIQAWVTNGFVGKTTKINNKPLTSNVTLSAEDVGAIPSSQKGTANGVASLDENGRVVSSQLPGTVDEIVEGYLHTDGKFYKEAAHTTVLTGGTGKIYVDLQTGIIYRWSGTMYVEISSTIALGETSSTAYPGDKGKTAYMHSQAAHARTDATKTAKSNQNGNIKINDVDTPVYEHPTAPAKASGLYKVTVDALGHVTGATAVVKKDITDLGIPEQDTNTTYSPMTAATASADGKTGLVPAPTAGKQASFLRGDGTWAVPENTTYEAITNAEIDALFTS